MISQSQFQVRQRKKHATSAMERQNVDIVADQGSQIAGSVMVAANVTSVGAADSKHARPAEVLAK